MLALPPASDDSPPPSPPPAAPPVEDSLRHLRKTRSLQPHQPRRRSQETLLTPPYLNEVYLNHGLGLDKTTLSPLPSGRGLYTKLKKGI
jgi:hypothetical protein